MLPIIKLNNYRARLAAEETIEELTLNKMIQS